MLHKLISEASPRVGNTRFVAIDGHGGSGKSTFSDRLAKFLDAAVVRTDDFASWDNPLNWYHGVIEKVFEPISRGENLLNYPRAKWWENHEPQPMIDQPVTPIMIIEGVSALRREFRPFLSLGIFVDTPLSLCLKRGIARDRVSGKTEAELETLWREWHEQELAYFKRDNPREYAQVILDGSSPTYQQLTK